MALDWTQLANEVDANDTVDGSASVLLTNLTAMIAELKTQMTTPEDQAKVQAFADRLAASRGQLQTAITNNTPQQQPPAPVSSTATGSVDQQQAAARAARAQNPGGIGGTPREEPR